MMRVKILAAKRHTFKNLEYKGDPKEVFAAIDDYVKLLKPKKRTGGKC